MKLKEALNIRDNEVVISLVGGGGKTTLMFALARELVSGGESVITTTTTKILEPSLFETPLLLLEAEEEQMVKALSQDVKQHQHITLGSERLPNRKLSGISSKLVNRLAGLNQVSRIIVEADGAAQKSLKAPNLTEPVIPNSTSLLIPVVGIDALGCRLTERDVFRPEIVSTLLSLPLGEVISAEAIAFLVTQAQGISKGCPSRARIVPFINKIDLDKDLSKGRDLAGEILAMRHPQIDRVVLGQVLLPDPVLEVVPRKS